MPSKCFAAVLAVCGLAGFTLANVAQAQLQDQVYQINNDAQNKGTVTKMTPASVTLTTTVGVEREFPVNEIEKITYSDDPGELRRGREAALLGRYEDALTELGPVDAAAAARSVVKQDIEFYKAYCAARLALAGTGDKQAAAVSMKAFLDSAPGSYHYFEASKLFGDLALNAGRYAVAEEYYRKVLQAPWPDYKLRAGVLLADTMLAQQKYPEALDFYQKVAAFNATTPEAQQQKLYASVGVAICKAKTGAPEDGIKMIEEIIAKNDPKDMALFGRAYNALGSCYAATNKPEEAVMAYLHTDILFYADPEAHAEALYNLADLWDKLQKTDRATQARKLLKSRYAGSRYAAL